MTTASIQTLAPCDQDRLAFWADAADLHGIALTDDDLAMVRRSDDLTVVRSLFARLGDPEHDELLWAAARSTPEARPDC